MTLNRGDVELKASELARAAEGTLVGPDRIVSGASIDSRSIAPGQLFVPVVAERDGHDFIPNAVARGATAYLTSQIALDLDGSSAIVVDDTVAALHRCASWIREPLARRVIGVTGSVGKTTVKDMTVAILQRHTTVESTRGNFNNQLGLPISMLASASGLEVFVAEMGMRALGDITELCNFSRPDIGVITRIAESHLGELGSIDAIVDAKSELVAALPAEGTAVLDRGSEWFEKLCSRSRANVLSYGVDTGDVRASLIQLDDKGRPSFTLTTPDGNCSVQLKVMGRHMAYNAACAAAAAFTVGSPIEVIAEGLSSVVADRMRMKELRTSTGALLLNDCYNASPTSTRAGLEALAAVGCEGRRVALLGEMKELGPDAESFHTSIAARASELGIEVIAFGTALYGPQTTDIEGAIEVIRSLDKGDAVLIKGSRSVGMETVTEELGRRGLLDAEAIEPETERAVR